MIKYLIAWVINMLYKEFEKIQEQLINILIDYAYFLKKGAQLNYKYTAEFKDEILKDFHLRNENTLLITAVTMLNEKKSLEEVDKFIDNFKKNYEIEFNKMNQRISMSLSVVGFNNTDDSIKELEDHFKDCIRKYNPMVRMEENPDFIKVYDLLQILYQQNNYQTYFATYDLFKDLLKEKKYEGVNFDKYLSYYTTLMQKITVDTKERVKNYPYIKEEVLKMK